MKRLLLAGLVIASCTSTPPSAAPPGSIVAIPSGQTSSTPTVVAAPSTEPPIAIPPAATASPSASAAATSEPDATTSAAIAALDVACGVGVPRTIPLAELSALADGRSAEEFVDVVGRSRCSLTAEARGRAPSELALISNYNDTAIFWVDRGWWRASVQPLMRPGVMDDRIVRGGRELTIGICPCGSGGLVGFALLRIEDSVLTPLVIARPGTSHVSVNRLGDDLIHMVGRGGDGRPVAWTANCCMPGVRQWLFARRGAAFELIAERQAYDPYYVAGLFFGGMKNGRADALGDVATPEAISVAKTIFTTPLEAEPSILGLGERDELMSWTAIPAAFRRPPQTAPFVVTIGLYPPTSGTPLVTQRVRVELRARNDGSGWYVAGLERVL